MIFLCAFLQQQNQKISRKFLGFFKIFACYNSPSPLSWLRFCNILGPIGSADSSFIESRQKANKTDKANIRISISISIDTSIFLKNYSRTLFLVHCKAPRFTSFVHFQKIVDRFVLPLCFQF